MLEFDDDANVMLCQLYVYSWLLCRKAVRLQNVDAAVIIRKDDSINLQMTGGEWHSTEVYYYYERFIIMTV